MPNHSAAVLRNKGVAVKVYETVITEEGIAEVARTEKGDAKTTTAWIRFDGNVLAELEEAYGDLGEYQKATGANPYLTVRRTLSLAFGWDDLHPPRIPGQPEPSAKLCAGCRRAGLAMREGGVAEYSTAIGAALALANGLDPTNVVKLLEQGAKAQTEMEEQRDKALADVLEELAAESAAKDADETPGSTSTAGSSNGSEPVGATTSSGG